MDANQAFKEMFECSGINKNQLAVAAGVKPVQVYKCLGGSRIGADVLAKYAEICGYDLILVPKSHTRFLPDQAIRIQGDIERKQEDRNNRGGEDS